jgi:ribonuclease BN (tRNA processing enzyme)
MFVLRVSARSKLVLLGFGPGAREPVWERGLLGAIDAIVITHMHIDHMLNLLGLSGEVTEIAARERHPDYRPPSCTCHVGAVGRFSPQSRLRRARIRRGSTSRSTCASSTTRTPWRSVTSA